MKKYSVSMAAMCAGALCLMAQPAYAQIWEDVSSNAQTKISTQSKAPKSMDWSRKISTNADYLNSVLRQAPHAQLGASDTTIDLPLPDGGVSTFAITYSPIMAPGLAAKRPDIRTFQVVDTTNPANTGRLDITPLGFHGMFKLNGTRVFIDPATDKDTYYSYYDSDYSIKEGLGHLDGSTCSTEHNPVKKSFTPYDRKGTAVSSTQKIDFGANLRTYRMAVAATGEYTQYFGGSVNDGQAAIVTAINRLNVIFESEMAVRLELVADNTNVIYTDPDTDPFTHSDRSELLNEIGGVLDAEIGNANYDIGHVFGVFGGGTARLAAVCGSGKARGTSGSSRPERSSFITLLAHEVGHQFNAPHSFNGSTSNCGSNRSGSSAVEPHSGSTIMSYAGICGSENLSGGKNDFFHNSSLTFMNDFVENPSRGGRCPVLVPNNNNAPVVDAGPDGVIPISTPFTLTGDATDADGDALTHIWEQVDVGPRNEGPNDVEDEGQRALFRSFQPVASPSRTFPQLARVLAGDRVMGEVLPSQDRNLTFRMTTRDNKGGVTDDERILQVVAAAGPFVIDTPTGGNLTGGTIQTVTWDVANTTDDPINCSAVNIALSTDGGQTFPNELRETTANDGTANVTIPNVSTTTARLKVGCTTQPFFTINDSNFTITQSVAVNEAPVAINDTFAVEEDSLRTQFDVLSNDNDPEGDTLTLASVSAPSANGTANIASGLIEYSPDPGFTGTETFTYVIEDGNSNSASGTVTVTVTPKPNIAPDAADDSLTVDQDSSATRIDVLSNDTDADGDTLTIQSLGTPNNGGTVQIDAGQVSYTPAQGFSGSENFTYVVSDGEGGTATGNVSVTVTAAPPPPPPPPPPSTVSPPPLGQTLDSSGGGGAFGPFLLLILGLKSAIARRREKLLNEV